MEERTARRPDRKPLPAAAHTGVGDGLRRLPWLLSLVASALLLAPHLEGQRSRKKDEEPKTQVLPLPKETPMALAADAGTLTFRVTPLLRVGKLSMQIRDALNEVLRDAHGAEVVRLRAFVAGAGDSRRVQALVSEIFGDRKQNLPVVSIVQVGALGDDAAQVVIESVLAERHDTNPGGLIFFAGRRARDMEASTGEIDNSLTQLSLGAASVVSVTCFLDNLGDYRAQLQAATTRFPNASVNLMQSQRLPGGDVATCEAIARAPQTQQPAASAMALVRATLIAHRVVFTGLQLGFGNYLDDAASALDRMRKTARGVDGIWGSMASFEVFSLSGEAASAMRKTAAKFAVPDRAITIQAVEGLPSLDASFGAEAIMPASESVQASGGGR